MTDLTERLRNLRKALGTGQSVNLPQLMDDAEAAADLLVAQADEVASLRRLVSALLDEEECYYDHSGNCQAHMWFDLETTCPHKQARALGVNP